MGGVSKKRKRRFKALAEAARIDTRSSDSPSTSSLLPGPPSATAAATGSYTESSLTTLDYYRVDSSESEYVPTPIKRMARHDAGKVHLLIT